MYQRGVGAVLEPSIGVGAPKIANRAVIGDIGATVGTEAHIGRAVEPADAVRESLLEGLVVGKALQVQCGRLTPSAGEIDQLDLMPDLGGRCAGIGWRKAEIAFEVVEGAARPSAIPAADPLSATRRRIGKVAARFGSSPRACGLAPVGFAASYYARVVGPRLRTGP